MVISGPKFGRDFHPKISNLKRLFLKKIAIFDEKLNSLTILHYAKEHIFNKKSVIFV